MSGIVFLAVTAPAAERPYFPGGVSEQGAKKRETTMKRALLAAAFIALATPAAQAATLTADGVTYDLDLIGGSLASQNVTLRLTITGINGAADTEGGRSAINDIAFSTAGLPNGVTLTGTSAFGTFQSGGLDANGCNGNGGFFCFNGPATNTSPPLAANSSQIITFSLMLASGTFADWDPSFKIDWLGSQNNYDLVSKDIDINNLVNPPPPPPPPEVPLPGAVYLFGTGLAGLWALQRRRKKKQEAAALLAA